MAVRDYAEEFSREVDLDPARVALVIVDLQLATASREHGLGRLLAEAGQEASGAWRFDRIEQSVVPNTQRLLEGFRSRGAAVVHLVLGARSEDFSDIPPYLRGLAQRTDNRVGRPNHAILPAVVPVEGEPVITKTTASAFVSTDLDEVLRSSGIEQLVFAGVSTNTCVESTARDAADLGYGCILAEDACGGPSAELHDAAIVNYARLFGEAVATDEVLARLVAP